MGLNTNNKTAQHLNVMVWVVDSDYTGELHARIGLADRLGFGFQIIPKPNGNMQYYLTSLKEKYQQSNTNNSPLLIVISGTGEETTEAIADLRSVFNNRLFNIYLASILPEQQHPRLLEYDLIVSPQLSGEKIVSTIGVSHGLTHTSLAQARKQHADFFLPLKKPIITVLLGGNTRYCNGFTTAHAQCLASKINSINQTLNGSLVITNSRRTPDDALSILLSELTGHYHFFDWRKADHSIYHAMLAYADLLIVTGDSLSMCSEAAYTGTPLLVDMTDNAMEKYHQDIIAKLIEYGAAKPLTHDYQTWTYEPLDPTGEVAKAVFQCLQA